MQPGDTITPGGTPNPPEQPVQEPLVPPAPAPAPPPEQPQPPAPLPTPEPEPAQPIPAEPNPFTADESQFNFAAPSLQPLSWTASEFVEHQKPQGWYLVVGVAAILVSAGLYFLTHDIITVVVVALVAVMFAMVAARKPRTLTYMLDALGIQVGDKHYPYADFKSFSVIEEDAMDSIQLLPMKRFMPPLSIYFPPEQEEPIIVMLADYLPHEEREAAAVDRLMKRVRF